MLNGLDLFSGIGGLTVALSPWVRPIAYCENERYAQAVLLSRQSGGELPSAPIWDDVRTLGHGCLSADVDIIYGGFPCQDISVAGAGRGLEGQRSGLYFEVERLVREHAPAFVFLENVPAIRTRGGERVVKGLASMGYDCRWTTLSAAQVGAPHKRERWWLLAAHSERLNAQGSLDVCRQTREAPCDAALLPAFPRWERLDDVPESAVLGRNHGLPAYVDRIRAVGNAVVPAQAREAFRILMGLV